MKLFNIRMKKILAVTLVLSMICGLFAGNFQVAANTSTNEDITLIACSDFQPLKGNAAGKETVKGILSSMAQQSGITSADGFFCCGDYDVENTETEQGVTALKEAVSGVVTENMVFVQGNHDSAIGTAGMSQSGNNDPASDKYGVFVINEDDYMWQSSGDGRGRVKSTAQNLINYMNQKIEDKYNKPIFVLSHVPLHYSMRTKNDGDGMHANYIFDVLNQAAKQGLNIIFLYGHDHNNGWDDYLGGSSVYLAKGDQILIAQNSKTEFKQETLAFTYMNAGYVGYYGEENSGVDATLTMTSFKISNNQVVITRHDKDGVHNLKSAGVTNSFKGESGYAPNTTVYTSPQTLTLTAVSDFRPIDDIVKYTNETVATKTWDFEDATQLNDFNLTNPNNQEINGGILKTKNVWDITTKAVLKTPFESGILKSVSVDIIPSSTSANLNAVVWLGASGVTQGTSASSLAFQIASADADKNNVIMMVGNYNGTGLSEKARVTSNATNNNALYSNNEKKPLNLRLDIYNNRLVATLSLVDNPTKYVQMSYACDTSKIVGQVVLHPFHTKASFDNLKIQYLQASQVQTEEKTWDFSTATQLNDFDIYRSNAEVGVGIQDGILKTSGRYGQKKIMVKTPFEGERLKSVSVDIIPGASDRPIDVGILLGASGAKAEDDKVNALGFLVESANASDPSYVLLGAAGFSQGWGGWKNGATIVSRESNNNALFSNGQKKPLNLKLDFYSDKYNDINIVATLSLVENPDVKVQTIYVCEASQLEGQIGLRTHYSDASFDNLKIEYIPDNVETLTSDYECVSGMLFNYGLTGGFVAYEGFLVPSVANGEGKVLLKETMDDYESVSVDIYPGQTNKINSGIYIGATGAQDKADSIHALTVMIESNFTDANRVDIVIGGFPTWAQYHRTSVKGDDAKALFTNGQKQPLNLKVEIDGKNIKVTVSLLSDPTKSVTAEYTYNGTYDLEKGQVGLRSMSNDCCFDNFKVKSSQSEKIITFESMADMDAFDFYHSLYGDDDGVATVVDNTLALHKTATFTEGTFSVELNTAKNKNAGIIFGADAGANNYYLYRLTADRYVELVKVENGTETVLDRGYLSAGHDVGRFNRLEVVREGNNIYCYYYNQFDNVKCYAVHEDATPLSGTSIGLWSEKAETAFKNVTISNEKEIRKADVLIFGHSYTEMWGDYETYFPEYQSLDNIGIGGSIATHWEDLTDEIIAYEPKLGIYDIGINDLSNSIKPREVIASIERAMLTVKEALPEFEVILVSVSHCPARPKITQQISDTNALMRLLASEYDWMYYAEAEYLFCTDKTDPTSVDSKYFISDKLHPSAAGYQLMAESIKNVNRRVDRVVEATWDFEDASQLDDFELTNPNNQEINGGILKTKNVWDITTKAVLKTPYESGILKSVSVDIIPSSTTDNLNAVVWLGASGVTQGTSASSLAFQIASADADKNNIIMMVGDYNGTGLSEKARVTSNATNNNALYSNGEKKPLNLKLDLYEDKIVATLSLVDNPEKQVKMTYAYDISKIEGQVVLHPFHTKTSFDNLTIGTLEKVYAKTWDFENASQLKDFDLTNPNNQEIKNGILKTKNVWDVTTKAVLKTPFESGILKSVSVDIIPSSTTDNLNAVVWLGASGVTQGTSASSLAFQIASADADKNNIIMMVGDYNGTGLSEKARVTSNAKNNNALYSNNEKKPLNLKLDIYEDKIVATLSLVDNPEKQVRMTYAYDTSKIEGQVVLHPFHTKASFDNLSIEYLPVEETPIIADKKALQEAIDAAEALNEEDYAETNWKSFSDALEQAKAILADVTALQSEVDAALANLKKAQKELTYEMLTYGFDDMNEVWDFDFYHSGQGFVIRDGKLTSPEKEGESKAMLKGTDRAYKSISVDIYPGDDEKINGGLYLYAAGSGHAQDKIHGLYVGLESNYTGWADAKNRVDIVVGTFPTWKLLSRTISEGGKGNAIFTNGQKQPVNLQVDIEDNVLTITVSLISNPNVNVQTVYEYTGEGNLQHGRVGIRSHWAKNSFDNFVVKYENEEYDEYAIPGAVKPSVDEDADFESSSNSNTGVLAPDKGTSTETTSPGTGDQGGMMLAATMLVVSFGTILFLSDRKRRRR